MQLHWPKAIVDEEERPDLSLTLNIPDQLKPGSESFWISFKNEWQFLGRELFDLIMKEEHETNRNQ